MDDIGSDDHEHACSRKAVGPCPRRLRDKTRKLEKEEEEEIKRPKSRITIENASRHQVAVRLEPPPATPLAPIAIFGGFPAMGGLIGA